MFNDSEQKGMLEIDELRLREMMIIQKNYKKSMCYCYIEDQCAYLFFGLCNLRFSQNVMEDINDGAMLGLLKPHCIE
ncbi:unnamed protein product [Rhizophagus irregularis]|nr:unnamed protein product [Rhizophagus irregularis]